MEIIVETQTKLPKLERIGKNLKTKLPRILDSIGAYMEASVVETFEAQGRPQPWVKNAPSTLKRKRGSMILHESGMLRAGITHWVEDEAVYIGPSGPSLAYARIQKKGGVTGRGYATVIPARDYLVVQVDDNTCIISMIRREVLDG